ncbi:MAG TPA: helix-turn-helix domain-containing protein [Solirubrobacterales bacterium]|nr:helix-turn-helix domain-containing protein [Solirubrobacterales bacterium]
MASFDEKKLKQVIDPTLAKAFTHPLRGHVWVTVCEKGLASPTEIANELDIEVTEVSYHFRKLHRKELIKVAYAVQRRGFDEHFYEPCAPAIYFDDFDWMGIPEAIRSSFSVDLVQGVVEELIGAIQAGSFDARDRHLSRTWLMLDERGWKELMRTLVRTLERAKAIQERSEKRCEGSPEALIPVEFAMAAFETIASIAQRVGETEEI